MWMLARSQLCRSHVIWIGVHVVWNVTASDVVLLDPAGAAAAGRDDDPISIFVSATTMFYII
jgi:hypothetical protein